MTTPDVTLLPCPKCEGLDLNPNWTEVESTRYHHVQCDECGHIVGDMGEYTTASSARDAWNTRATPEPAGDILFSVDANDVYDADGNRFENDL